MRPLVAGLLLAIAPPASAQDGQPKPPAVPIVDGGFCAGFAWIRLQPGETVSMTLGPDFDVYYVQSAGMDMWGVYAGGYAHVEAGGPVLVGRDGASIRRGSKGARFGGYLAVQGPSQLHFFGSVFNDSRSDLAFFERVTFGAAARTRCKPVG